MQKELLSQIVFGEMQHYGPVAVLPLYLSSGPGALDYLTLVEAIGQMMLKVMEVSEHGSVPELKVINTGPLPILLVSGEEVKGAKQNRIVNTSILVPAMAELVIPVSCTESGRWHYDAPDFEDSGNISNMEMRRSADESVRSSLDTGRGHRSDQGLVWDKIEALHMKVGSDNISNTRAMNDAYKLRGNELEEAAGHFPLLPGQNGILVLLEGKAAGMDIVSQPGAFSRLHGKLVKSYLIESFGKVVKVDYGQEALQREALRFLDDAAAGEVKVFKSVGLGEDHRLLAPEVQGSCLVFNGEAIHSFCFRRETKEGHMASFSRRNRLM